jgi:hypothetical protein
MPGNLSDCTRHSFSIPDQALAGSMVAPRKLFAIDEDDNDVGADDDDDADDDNEPVSELPSRVGLLSKSRNSPLTGFQITFFATFLSVSKLFSSVGHKKSWLPKTTGSTLINLSDVSVGAKGGRQICSTYHERVTSPAPL